MTHRIYLVAAVSAVALISACQKPAEPAANDMATANDMGAMNEAAPAATAQSAQLTDATAAFIPRRARQGNPAAVQCLQTSGRLEGGREAGR